MPQKVKIFISYHEEHPLIKSEILTPIQTGCSSAVKLFDGMLCDNTGDNISAANDRYCELSAQYWVGTHLSELGNPDYIGFMHYRRHFIFDEWKGNPDWCWLPKGDVYFIPYMTPAYFKHLSDKNILKALQNVDCLVIKPYDVKNLDSQTVRKQYCKLPEQHGENFDKFIAVCKKLYPQYLPEIEQIEQGSVQYLCNMFVMKRKLFSEYNDFCFKVLQAVDAEIDSSRMGIDEARFLGYFGEFLLSIYVFHLLKQPDIRVKEVSAAYVLNDEYKVFPYLQYYKYKLLSKITFGRKKAHCRKKYQYYKALKKAEKLMQG